MPRNRRQENKPQDDVTFMPLSVERRRALSGERELLEFLQDYERVPGEEACVGHIGQSQLTVWIFKDGRWHRESGDFITQSRKALTGSESWCNMYLKSVLSMSQYEYDEAKKKLLAEDEDVTGVYACKHDCDSKPLYALVYRKSNQATNTAWKVFGGATALGLGAGYVHRTWKQKQIEGQHKDADEKVSDEIHAKITALNNDMTVIELAGEQLQKAFDLKNKVPDLTSEQITNFEKLLAKYDTDLKAINTLKHSLHDKHVQLPVLRHFPFIQWVCRTKRLHALIKMKMSENLAFQTLKDIVHSTDLNLKVPYVDSLIEFLDTFTGEIYGIPVENYSARVLNIRAFQKLLEAIPHGLRDAAYREYDSETLQQVINSQPEIAGRAKSQIQQILNDRGENVQNARLWPNESFSSDIEGQNTVQSLIDFFGKDEETLKGLLNAPDLLPLEDSRLWTNHGENLVKFVELLGGEKKQEWTDKIETARAIRDLIHPS
jgi:hypothetical protein